MELKDFLTKAGIDEEYYNATWVLWKSITRYGVYQVDDNQVRDLFVRFSEIVSSLSLVLGEYQVNAGRKKLNADNKLAYLLSVVYPQGAVSQRTIDAKSNIKYIETLTEQQDAETELILVKAMINANQIAADSLSRELSYRIKTN